MGRIIVQPVWPPRFLFSSFTTRFCSNSWALSIAEMRLVDMTKKLFNSVQIHYFNHRRHHINFSQINFRNGHEV